MSRQQLVFWQKLFVLLPDVLVLQKFFYVFLVCIFFMLVLFGFFSADKIMLREWLS
jgi:hypothetical protein